MAAAALNVTRIRQVTSQRRIWPTTATATAPEVTSAGVQSLKSILTGSGKIGPATTTTATATQKMGVDEDDSVTGGESGNGNDQDPDSTEADE
jgi:hypothetical protein